MGDPVPAARLSGRVHVVGSGALAWPSRLAAPVRRAAHRLWRGPVSVYPIWSATPLRSLAGRGRLGCSSGSVGKSDDRRWRCDPETKRSAGVAETHLERCAGPAIVYTTWRHKRSPALEAENAALPSGAAGVSVHLRPDTARNHAGGISCISSGWCLALSQPQLATILRKTGHEYSDNIGCRYRLDEWLAGTGSNRLADWKLARKGSHPQTGSVADSCRSTPADSACGRRGDHAGGGRHNCAPGTRPCTRRSAKLCHARVAHSLGLHTGVRGIPDALPGPVGRQRSSSHDLPRGSTPGGDDQCLS